MNHRRQPLIGIIGAIGAGKSTVARMFGELGCVVAHSDEMARAALLDPKIKRSLAEWWGDGILDGSGEVDRSAVAKIVFNDPVQRKRLESITHPWIEARRRELFAAAPPDAPALVIDAPLLLEAGLERECDAVVFVDAPPAVRQKRVAAERGWDAAELARRELSQMSLDEKRRRADYVVVNDGDLAALNDRVRSMLKEIVSRSQSSFQP